MAVQDPYAWRAGEERPLEPPRGAAEDEERREKAARRPGPQRDEPHSALDQQQLNDDARRKAVVEQRLNSAVTGAEHMRVDQPAEPDDNRAERRPPHPVDRQSVEQGLDPVEEVRP